MQSIFSLGGGEGEGSHCSPDKKLKVVVLLTGVTFGGFLHATLSRRGWRNRDGFFRFPCENTELVVPGMICHLTLKISKGPRFPLALPEGTAR
jgi:hypothetical protein